MNIGKLDRKIVIEQSTSTRNDHGEDVYVWTVFLTLFASVKKAGGKENSEGGKDTATNRKKFKVRFFPSITEKMRIDYNGDKYDIEEIQELGREGLWITATKKN